MVQSNSYRLVQYYCVDIFDMEDGDVVFNRIKMMTTDPFNVQV